MIRSLMITLVLILAGSGSAWANCVNDLVQDLNCNGIDAQHEVLIDLTDPVCAANLDGAGEPYPNADYYYDYATQGCLWLLDGKTLRVYRPGPQGTLTLAASTGLPSPSRFAPDTSFELLPIAGQGSFHFTDGETNIASSRSRGWWRTRSTSKAIGSRLRCT